MIARVRELGGPTHSASATIALTRMPKEHVCAKAPWLHLKWQENSILQKPFLLEWVTCGTGKCPPAGAFAAGFIGTDVFCARGVLPDGEVVVGQVGYARECTVLLCIVSEWNVFVWCEGVWREWAFWTCQADQAQHRYMCVDLASPTCQHLHAHIPCAHPAHNDQTVTPHRSLCRQRVRGAVRRSRPPGQWGQQVLGIDHPFWWIINLEGILRALTVRVRSQGYPFCPRERFKSVGVESSGNNRVPSLASFTWVVPGQERSSLCVF